MFEAELRRLIDRSMATAAHHLVRTGVRANWITFAGGIAAFLAMLFVARDHYWIALGFVVLNRLLDGLDGAVARASPTGPTERGAYLDTVFDALFFASVPFGFGLAGAERAVAAVFLMFGLLVLGAASRQKAFGVGLGVTEALVLVVIYAFVCVLPGWFSIAAYALGLAAFILAGVRVASAVNTLS